MAGKKQRPLTVQSFAPVGPDGENILIAETDEDGGFRWCISEETREKLWQQHAQSLLDSAAESLSK